MDRVHEGHGDDSPAPRPQDATGFTQDDLGVFQMLKHLDQQKAVEAAVKNIDTFRIAQMVWPGCRIKIEIFALDMRRDAECPVWLVFLPPISNTRPHIVGARAVR